MAPKQQQQKKKTRKKKTTVVAPSDSSLVRLGVFLLAYLKCLLSPSRFMSGIPAAYNLPSQKTHGWYKGTFSTPTGVGVGWVAFSPPLASDALSVWYTDGSATSTTISTTVAGPIQSAILNLPFTTAQLAAKTVQARLVAAELKVRNVTARLSASGDVYGMQQPDHDTLVGATVGLFNAFEESARFSGVDQRTITLNYLPALNSLTDESEYTNAAGPFVSGGALFPIMAFMASAPAAQTFEFECHVVVEYIGSAANSRTPSNSDPIGIAVTQNLFHSNSAASRPTMDDFETRFQRALVSIGANMEQMTCVCPMR